MLRRELEDLLGFWRSSSGTELSTSLSVLETDEACAISSLSGDTNVEETVEVEEIGA